MADATRREPAGGRDRARERWWRAKSATSRRRRSARLQEGHRCDSGLVAQPARARRSRMKDQAAVSQPARRLRLTGHEALDGLPAASLLLAAAPPLLAQDQPAPPRLMRGDVSGTLSWVSINKSDVRSYNDWHSQFGVSGGAGWYWTDHHKTQVEFAATTAASVYSSEPIVVGPQQQTFVTTVRSYESQRVSLTQLYQFRRNEWVHPFLGAGLDIVREQSSGRDDPAYWYDPIVRQSRLARETVQHGKRVRDHGPCRPDRRGQGLLLEKGVRVDRSAGRRQPPPCRRHAVALRPWRRLLARLRLRRARDELPGGSPCEDFSA